MILFFPNLKNDRIFLFDLSILRRNKPIYFKIQLLCLHSCFIIINHISSYWLLLDRISQVKINYFFNIFLFYVFLRLYLSALLFGFNQKFRLIFFLNFRDIRLLLIFLVVQRTKQYLISILFEFFRPRWFLTAFLFTRFHR